MKRILRIVCLIMAVICMGVTVNAEESSQKASNYFAAYRAYCTATSPAVVTVSFHVVAVGEMDEVGASEIVIQKSSNGTDWSPAYTFTKEGTSGMIATDTGSYASTISVARSTGYYYRAHVTFYAKNSSGVGYRHYYTERV